MTRSSPILDVRQLRKSIGPRELLAGVDLSVHDGERIGLVGQNGCGKSTLARYLAGLEQPDAGTLALRGDATVGYLDQVPTFDPEATALEVVLRGLGPWSEAYARYEASTKALQQEGDATRWHEVQREAAEAMERHGGWVREHEARALLERMGITRMEARVGTMSGGELRRVALARMFINPPTLAILDEPTNHLDVETIEWMENYLRRDFSGALILITHDRYILDRVVTRTAELHDGQLSFYQGGWSTFLEEKVAREAHEARTLANRRNIFRRELAWLRTQPKARGTKSKARTESAEALGETIRDAKPAPRLSGLALQVTRAQRRILEIQELTLTIEGRTLVRDLTLHLGRGERVGVVGPNGAGKTTLLRALLGVVPAAAGRIKKSQNTEFLYVDQRKDMLDLDRTVIQNVSGGLSTVAAFGRQMAVQSWLEQFLFFGDVQRAPVGSLSGGERARVALAKAFLSPGNFLLLDEPTNDLDVTTLAALETLLQESEVSAFVVTHDRYFLDRVATSILAFEGDGKVVKYEGDYSHYERVSREHRAARGKEPRKASAAGVASGRNKKPSQAGLTYGERLELEKLEQEIAKLETELSQVERDLADSDLYAHRGHEVPERQAKYAAIRQQLQTAMECWEQLEEKRDPQPSAK